MYIKLNSVLYFEDAELSLSYFGLAVASPFLCKFMCTLY